MTTDKDAEDIQQQEAQVEEIHKKNLSKHNQSKGNPIDECPVCGGTYELAFEVETGSNDIGGRMYHTDRICYRERDGEYLGYIHGEPV